MNSTMTIVIYIYIYIYIYVYIYIYTYIYMYIYIYIPKKQGDLIPSKQGRLNSFVKSFDVFTKIKNIIKKIIQCKI